MTRPLLALALASCAAQNNPAPLPVRPEAAPVMAIVAARDLYPGVTITEADLYAVKLPPNYLPEGVYLSPGHVVGQSPAFRILANEFVRPELLALPESGHGIGFIVPVGLRAVQVPLNGGAAPLQGYVDAWWTPPGGKPCVVLAAAYVLTWDGVAVPPAPPPVTVQLLAPTARPLGLTLAARDPSFRLVARNTLDVGHPEVLTCSQ